MNFQTEDHEGFKRPQGAFRRPEDLPCMPLQVRRAGPQVTVRWHVHRHTVVAAERLVHTVTGYQRSDDSDRVSAVMKK